MKFAGYAALFAVPDAARDTIRPGAFARTLAERERPLPLCWQHRPEQRIGWVERIAEDARGLRVIAALDNPYSRAAAMLRTGSVSGLSFGYRARTARHGPAGRTLEDIDLIEVSLVTHPLQHRARVHLVLPETGRGDHPRPRSGGGGGAPSAILNAGVAQTRPVPLHPACGWSPSPDGGGFLLPRRKVTAPWISSFPTSSSRASTSPSARTRPTARSRRCAATSTR